MNVPGGIVLVVPQAGSEVDQHFAHTYALAEELARLVPTAVIVERVMGVPPRPISGVRTFTQSQTPNGALARSIELVREGLRLRRQGYDTFFVRTSQTAAVPLSAMTRLVGGRTLYWNCVQPKRPPIRKLGVRAAVTSELPVRWAFRLADRVVTGTESLAARYTSMHGIPRHRMAVLPNEIALTRYGVASPQQSGAARKRLGLPTDARLILSVHRLSPVRQTLRYLPAAAERVLATVPNALFALVGGGPDEAALRAAVEAASLSERFVMPGPVPHARICDYYHAADVFFMPSYSEGFPRVILEAMAMGVPFASTDVGGVSEVVPDVYRERLVSNEDVLGLADEIVELLRQPNLASDLAGAGREWVQRFDAPRVARRLVEIAGEAHAMGRRG